MTTRLGDNQRNNVLMAVAGYRTERATTGDMEAFYYEAQVDALDDLSDSDLLAAMDAAGYSLEDL